MKKKLTLIKNDSTTKKEEGAMGSRELKEDSIKLVALGNKESNSFAMSVNKAAINALRDGVTIPIKLNINNQSVTILMMRDRTFNLAMQSLDKLNEAARKSVEDKIQDTKDELAAAQNAEQNKDIISEPPKIGEDVYDDMH